MAALKAEGIILRKYFLRETSYIIVVFTREFGKIRGVLKGVRNPYPQFAGNFELFTHCDLLFYKKKKSGMDLITRCESIDFFPVIRKDIKRLTYASYFVELVDAVTGDSEADDVLYGTLLEGLRMLATESSPRRVARIFELKLLDAVGLAPILDICVECSLPLEGDIFFSVSSGGVLCSNCAGSGRKSFSVSRGTVNFMQKVRGIPFSKTQRIKVSKSVGMETERILRSFTGYHIGREMKSIAFLGELKKKGIIR